jgi:hypothetical protein
METELNTFIDNCTGSGETPADYFVETFLTRIGRLHSHETRIHVRALLSALGLLVADNGSTSGGKVTRALGGSLPVHSVLGIRTA